MIPSFLLILFQTNFDFDDFEIDTARKKLHIHTEMTILMIMISISKYIHIFLWDIIIHFYYSTHTIDLDDGLANPPNKVNIHPVLV